MTSKTFTPDTFWLNTMETCWIARLGAHQQQKIKNEPFHMAGGDVLNVGDMFTAIGRTGSAGNQPIKLTPPWVQRYEGIATLPDSDSWYPNRNMALFSALIPNETENFVSIKGREDTFGIKDGYYIAYLMHDDGTLFYLRGKACTSNVVKCQSIDRYHHD